MVPVSLNSPGSRCITPNTRKYHSFIICRQPALYISYKYGVLNCRSPSINWPLVGAIACWRLEQLIKWYVLLEKFNMQPVFTGNLASESRYAQSSILPEDPSSHTLPWSLLSLFTYLSHLSRVPAKLNPNHFALTTLHHFACAPFVSSIQTGAQHT